MDGPARALADALVAAFPAYARGRLPEDAFARAEVAEALSEGSARLAAGLSELLSLPSADQAATPLQVFREALIPVVEAAGLSPDDIVVPASAFDVSEEAGQASLAWGAATAADLVRPLVLVVSTNLMDVGPFEAAASRAGYSCEVHQGGDMSGKRPVVAFVDLELELADQAIEELAARGVRTIAYGPHVDAPAMVRARALGATVAEPRSRVLRDPAVYLPPLV